MASVPYHNDDMAPIHALADEARARERQSRRLTRIMQTILITILLAIGVLGACAAQPTEAAIGRSATITGVSTAEGVSYLTFQGGSRAVCVHTKRSAGAFTPGRVWVRSGTVTQGRAECRIKVSR